MSQFALFALLLLAAVLAILLPPLWFGRRAAPAAEERRAANLRIFRDQLAELEKEKAEGMLAEPDFQQAREELQRRLLEETVDSEAAANAAPAAARKTALALLVALPALGLAAYGLMGNPRALDPEARVAQKEMTQADIERMVARLAAKVEANPEDLEGWLRLARSYKTLGRYPDAAKAYARARPLVEKDPESLASYAETLVMLNGQRFAGDPQKLINQALKLDPQHAHSLFLAGAAAMEAGEPRKAVAYWEALLPQVEPGSEIDEMLRRGLAQMKEKAGIK